MLTPLVLTVAGFVLLFLGGEALVRGSVALARRLGISELAVGVILVGFGTSAPEFLVSVESALLGHADLALGNVIGSNIANILLIVGAAALVAPIALAERAGRRESAFVLIATAVVAGMAAIGDLGPWHGAAMLAGLALYLAAVWRAGGPVEADEGRPTGTGLALLYGAGGLGLLILGADLLVTGAVDIARNVGVSETVIGLTVVAIGSSLPELAAATVAAWRGRPSVAVGNVLGSNLFNLLGALGVVAIATPVGAGEPDVRFAMIALLALTACFAALVARRRIGRVEGAVFLAVYAAFVWAQFAMA